jgi:hypothetical protein
MRYDKSLQTTIWIVFGVTVFFGIIALKALSTSSFSISSYGMAIEGGIPENPQGCYNYVPGDVNDNGNANGLDVVYLVSYFKGGAPPPFNIGGFYPAADVNGNCAVNGLDVVYLVAFFKGQNDEILYCANYIPCPT